MNRKLTLVIGGILLGLGGLVASWHAGWFAQSEKSPQMPPSQADGPGNSIVRQAADAMQFAPPLEATIRQEVQLFGARIQSAGRYLQQGDGKGGIRIELKPSIDGDVGSYLRVSDGRFLYTRVTMMEQTRLTRIDLHELDKELFASDQLPAGVNDQQDWMLGGLEYLLARLDQDFAFEDAQPELLGDIPVWRLWGTWKEQPFQKMVELYTGHAPVPPFDLTSQLPEHLPTHVELLIARSEGPIGFPYRIRWIRVRSPFAGETVEDVVLAIDCLKLVWNAELNDDLFAYDPGDEEVEYVNDDYLATMSARGVERRR